MKYLDQGNMANAYVSGMQEELNMYGNEYTYAGSVYTIAYAVMQIPSTLIIQKVRPSLWLAVMEVCWGAFTFAQAGMHNVGQLYAFRFLVGLFESSFFPSLLYVLGSWYTKTELAKRVALFHMTAPLGSAFGGYLQAAVFKTLDGSHGLAGWRWLYVICGVSVETCPTINNELTDSTSVHDRSSGTRNLYLSARHTIHDPCMVPDREGAWHGRRKSPECWQGSASEDHSEDVQENSELLEVVCFRVGIHRKYNSSTLSCFEPCRLNMEQLFGSSCGGNGYFPIWLKSEGYSVVDRNIMPTGTSLISAACVVLWGFLSDYTGSRFAWLLIPMVSW